MSDKKLLEESAIRRFQALANIKPIGNGLLEEAAKKKPAEEKPAKGAAAKGEAAEGETAKKVTKESYAVTAEEAVEEAQHGGMEEKYQEETMHEAEGEEMEMAEPAAEEGGDDIRAALEDIKKGVDALLGKIEGASDLGFEVEDEEAGEEGGEGEEMPEMPEMGKEESLEEAESEEKKHPMEEEALAEELTRRVAARLVAEMKKGKKGGGNWLAKPSAAPKPKSKGSPTKGGTPFKGGKK